MIVSEISRRTRLFMPVCLGILNVGMESMPALPPLPRDLCAVLLCFAFLCFNAFWKGALRKLFQLKPWKVTNTWQMCPNTISCWQQLSCKFKQDTRCVQIFINFLDVLHNSRIVRQQILHLGSPQRWYKLFTSIWIKYVLKRQTWNLHLQPRELFHMNNIRLRVDHPVMKLFPPTYSNEDEESEGKKSTELWSRSFVVTLQSDPINHTIHQ